MIISFLKNLERVQKRSTRPPEYYNLNSKKERPWKSSIAFKLGSIVPDFIRQLQKGSKRIYKVSKSNKLNYSEC